MPKTDNKCWSCGQNTMISFEEVGRGWLKCSSCGATDMPHPTTLGQEQLVIEKAGPGSQDIKYRPRKKRLAKAPAR